MSIISCSQSTSEEAQPIPLGEKLWDVQAILAERHSSFQSGSEVLVAWKPCWIPIENVPAGPILSSFRDAAKARFQSSVGTIILPLDADTVLANDVASAVREAERQVLVHDQQQREQRGTPRKSLGCVAKKKTTQKTKNQ